LIEYQPLSDDALDGHIEALRLGHLTIIEPVGLLVEIPEQMKWLNAGLGSAQSALQ
jgi:hypothetical protein